MATQLRGPRRKGAKAVGAGMPGGMCRLGVIPGENGLAGGDRCVVVVGGREKSASDFWLGVPGVNILGEVPLLRNLSGSNT